MHARPVGTKLRWQSEGSAQAERVARAQVLCALGKRTAFASLGTYHFESPVVTLARPVRWRESASGVLLYVSFVLCSASGPYPVAGVSCD